MRFDAPTKKTLAVALTALVIVAAIPVAIMVGCNMPMVVNACLGHHMTIGQVFSEACTGIFVSTHAIEGIAASSMSILLLVLSAAFAMVVLLKAAESRGRAFVFVPVAPPPPPEDPLGQRLTL